MGMWYTGDVPMPDFIMHSNSILLYTSPLQYIEQIKKSESYEEIL